MGTRAERLNSSRTQYNDYKDTLPYIFFPACKQHNATIHDNILPRRKMDSHCIKLSILPACYNLLNLSISSRCNKSVKIRFVATCHNNLYTARNATDCWNNLYTARNSHRRVASCGFYRLAGSCQQVAASLLTSSSCSKSVKIRLVAP